MQVPLQITHVHGSPSEPLDTLVREQAAELEQFYSPIISCHVWIEYPSQHHRQGKGAHFRVHIELSVPGKTLVVSRDPAADEANEDAYLAATEAFHEMRRQLEDHARRQRGEVRAGIRPPHARVVRLHPEEDFGFLETSDGREIYFHRASVLGGGFDRLKVGIEVQFSEEPGERGPQASSVQLLEEVQEPAEEPGP